jgi:hypothetical protein
MMTTARPPTIIAPHLRKLFMIVSFHLNLSKLGTKALGVKREK